MEIYQKIIPNIHKEGVVFAVIALVATFILSILSQFLGILGLILSLFCIYFFRDPKRVTPKGDEWVVSPADGLVTSIGEAIPPEELGLQKNKMTRVSIFLSVVNVHVNRIPVSGIVENMHYRPGKFLNATLDKASTDNERQSILIRTKHNKLPVVCVQIAGLIARRIVCDIESSQSVKAGARFGIIRFGSRVDVYLPQNINLLVDVGQTMIGGETIIANLNNPIDTSVTGAES